MNSEELNTAFEKAFNRACHTNIKLPPDIMLHLYAYYKQATNKVHFHTPSGNSEVRNAFKLNALFQIKSLSPDEAKLKYIDLVNKHL